MKIVRKKLKELSAEDLISLWDIEISTKPNVAKMREAMGLLGSKIYNSPEFKPIKRKIEWSKRNGGIGYLSSSLEHDKDKEILYIELITNSFKNRELRKEPVIVPIDKFYSFVPDNASLVSKTRIFDNEMKKRNYALILTGISESEIFTPEILEQIPHQEKAGLRPSSKYKEFGNKLHNFAKGINLILEKNKGNLKKSLEEIAGKKNLEDARLLLATCLFLQDRQAWQDLWYENKKNGTPLYIIAPKPFHDSMNRLNIGWGHGGCDYDYRADCSLGANNEPIFETSEFVNYEDQGLSAEDFKIKVEKFL